MPRFRTVIAVFMILLGLALMLYIGIGWMKETIDITRAFYTFIPVVVCVVIGGCMLPSLCPECAARASQAAWDERMKKEDACAEPYRRGTKATHARSRPGGGKTPSSQYRKDN